jgi:hypothetical protein
MYITNIRSAGQICPECPTCETICEPQMLGQINLLGLVFFIACLATYFLYRKKIFYSFFRRKQYIKTLRSIGLIFLVLGMLYFIQLGINKSANSDCRVGGVMLEIKFWPSSIIPFTKG